MSQTTPVKKRSAPMSRADAAWLHMEEPTNLMMITALFTFPGPVEKERLATALSERLLAYDRFSMVATNPMLGLPQWKVYRNFQLEEHLEVSHLGGAADEEALLARVGDLMSTPLDRERPLWKFHLILGVKMDGHSNGSAIVVRLHHSIADGIALMKVLLSLTDPDPSSHTSAEEMLEAPVRKTASLVHTANITVKPQKIIRLAKVYSEAATDLGKLLLETEPKTPFKGRLGKAKCAARTKPLPLELVKQARVKAGCTVNDFLMACVAGGLRRHLERLGKPARSNLNLRAVIPVDLRRPGKDPSLGNRFGLVFLSLPVGLAEPEQRVAEVRKRMEALKSSPQAVVVLGLLNAVGSIPAEMQGHVVELFGSKATAVVTNVPGPKESLWLAGQRIESLMFWVPQSGRLGLGLSILSYDGSVRIGVATDAGLSTRADLLAQDVEAAFQELLALYGVAQ